MAGMDVEPDGRAAVDAGPGAARGADPAEGHPDPLKVWAAVRRDLGLSLGKWIAQAGHAFGNLFLDAWAARPDLMRAYLRGRTPGSAVDAGQPKVTVGVRNEARLRRVLREAQAAGIPCLAVVDEGKSEVAPGTMTMVVFGPARRSELPPYLADLNMLDPAG